jgi:hypothetical protein
MIHQFAINIKRQRLVHSGDYNCNRCLFWVEAIQASKSRRETYACDHPIVVLASVVNAIISQKMWIIVLCDSMGEKILVVVTPKESDNGSGIASVLRRFNSYGAIILSLMNPSIIVGTFPSDSEDKLKMLLVISEDQILLVDAIALDPKVPDPHSNSSNKSVEMRFFLERYWQLTNSLSQDLVLDSFSHENIQDQSEGCYPYNIRDLLMHEIYPRQRIPLSCVLGIITDIQLLLSTSSSSLDSSSQQNSERKKMKVEYCDKLMVTLRDTTFDDTIVVYLPVTSSTMSFCTIGMEISLFNPYLKCSSNRKTIYLECKRNEFCLGESVSHFTLTSIPQPCLDILRFLS